MKNNVLSALILAKITESSRTTSNRVQKKEYVIELLGTEIRVCGRVQRKLACMKYP